MVGQSVPQTVQLLSKLNDRPTFTQLIAEYSAAFVNHKQNLQAIIAKCRAVDDQEMTRFLFQAIERNNEQKERTISKA